MKFFGPPPPNSKKPLDFVPYKIAALSSTSRLGFGAISFPSAKTFATFIPIEWFDKESQ